MTTDLVIHIVGVALMLVAALVTHRRLSHSRVFYMGVALWAIGDLVAQQLARH